MQRTVEQANKELVLEGFDTLFNIVYIVFFP